MMKRTLPKVEGERANLWSEVIRHALDRLMEAESLPNRDEIRKRAIAANGSCHSGVSDLSQRHDDYLAEIYSE